jgi:hypothetical protein
VIGNEMGGAYGTYVERINARRVLIGTPEQRRPLRRPVRRWKCHNKMGGK